MFKLKPIIKKAGLSYKEICEGLNISRRTLDNWDSFKTHPTVMQFHELSELVKIDFCKLKIRVYG